jgi:hypothetical protein
LIGNREELLAEWREKLALPVEIPVPETTVPVAVQLIE